MPKRTLTARLRDAEKRNAALQREVRTLKGFVDVVKGDYSGTTIISNMEVTDVVKTAINTARRLGFVVTIAPDTANQGKFALRAHQPPSV